MGLLPSAIAAQAAVDSGQRAAAKQQQIVLNNSQPIAKPKTEQVLSPAQKPPSATQLSENHTSSLAKEPSTAPATAPPETEKEAEREAVAPISNQAGSIEEIRPATDQEVGNNLSQIWQQIIAHLHPLSKALLNEHGRLLGFDGQEARIGIGNDKLVKIAQGKLKDIEQAFADVFNQKVKVSLEVAAPTVPDQKGTTPDSAGKNSPPAQGETPTKSVNRTKNQPSPKTSGIDRTDAVTTQPPVTPPPESRANPGATSSPSPGKREAKPGEPNTSLVNSWEEDESARAARQLAEFFAGKVVNLSDNEDLPATPNDAIDFSESASVEDEPDDNVPF